MNKWYVRQDDSLGTVWGPFKTRHEAEEWGMWTCPDGNYVVYENTS